MREFTVIGLASVTSDEVLVAGVVEGAVVMADEDPPGVEWWQRVAHSVLAEDAAGAERAFLDEFAG